MQYRVFAVYLALGRSHISSAWEAMQAAIYKLLLDRAPLEAEARGSIARIITLLETDPALSLNAFATHLYPFVTQTLSAPQSIFLRHLRNFKGDLLAESYRHASHGRWYGPVDAKSTEEDASYYLEAIARVSQSIGGKALNSAQLAFSLTLFNLTEVYEPIGVYRLDDATLRRVLEFEYTQGNHFWRDHNVGLNELHTLGKELLEFDGIYVPSPEEVASRFALSISESNGRLRVTPVERWGVQRILDRQVDVQSELLLPTSFVTDDQLGEFSDLLDSDTAAEADWQLLLDRHPAFLYLFGDYDKHLREVTLSNQILLSPGDEVDLRPDFLLKRIDLPQWDILELKLPSARMAAGGLNRRRFSSAVQEARSQVNVYRDYFRDRTNLRRFQHQYGGQLGEPRMHILMGRDNWFNSPQEKVRLVSQSEVNILTYDDLFRLAKHVSLR